MKNGVRDRVQKTGVRETAVGRGVRDTGVQETVWERGTGDKTKVGKRGCEDRGAGNVSKGNGVQGMGCEKRGAGNGVQHQSVWQTLGWREHGCLG